MHVTVCIIFAGQGLANFHKICPSHGETMYRQLSSAKAGFLCPRPPPHNPSSVLFLIFNSISGMMMPCLILCPYLSVSKTTQESEAKLDLTSVSGRRIRRELWFTTRIRSTDRCDEKLKNISNKKPRDMPIETTNCIHVVFWHCGPVITQRFIKPRVTLAAPNVKGKNLSGLANRNQYFGYYLVLLGIIWLLLDLDLDLY